MCITIRNFPDSAQVTDLTTDNYDPGLGTFRIRFTAPGDDLDKGTGGRTVLKKNCYAPEVFYFFFYSILKTDKGVLMVEM